MRRAPFACVALVAACAAHGADPPSAPKPSAAPNPRASSPMPSDASPRDPDLRLPELDPRRFDGLWLAAARADPLEKGRLAVALGAALLMDAVRAGPPRADIALEALPYADDAPVALGELATLASSDAARRPKVLLAVLGIAREARLWREPLDPDGARACAAVLAAMARDGSLPASDRTLAATALSALVERGMVTRREGL